MDTLQKKAKATQAKKNETSKNANAKKEVKTPKKEEGKKAEESKKLDAILKPSADNRIKRAETFTRLAERKKKIDRKVDELTNFRASDDGTETKMEFTAGNGYHFKISNSNVVDNLLAIIEKDLFQLQEDTDNEILNFQI